MIIKLLMRVISDEERLGGAHEVHKTSTGSNGEEDVHRRGNFILIRTSGGAG